MTYVDMIKLKGYIILLFLLMSLKYKTLYLQSLIKYISNQIS
jgi:hypothetical protein